MNKLKLSHKSLWKSTATSSASQASAPFKLVERDGAIYKEAADTNDPVAPSKLPQEKFMKGHPRAIPGEFIVILQRGTTEKQVDTIAQEFVEEYGITIQKIWKAWARGFSAKMSESVALKISQDPRVDHVTESVNFSPIDEPKKSTPIQ